MNAYKTFNELTNGQNTVVSIPVSVLAEILDMRMKRTEAIEYVCDQIKDRQEIEAKQ